MASKDKRVVVTFFSHYEAKLMQRRLGGVLIPVPRRLSSSCGTALELEKEAFTFSSLSGDYDRVYLFDGENYEECTTDKSC